MRAIDISKYSMVFGIGFILGIMVVAPSQDRLELARAEATAAKDLAARAIDVSVAQQLLIGSLVHPDYPIDVDTALRQVRRAINALPDTLRY